jgi:hypothetical protein
MKIKQAEVRHIAIEEYEFSRVTDTQLPACYFLEHSREHVKDGGELPVEILDIISVGKGFPYRPYQCLARLDKEKVFKSCREVRGDARALAKNLQVQNEAMNVIIQELIKKKKSHSRMLRKHLKQLGVARLFKAGHSVETAMDLTFGSEKEDEDWLTRTKYRQYEKEGIHRVKNWPLCIIPRAEFSV